MRFLALLWHCGIENMAREISWDFPGRWLHAIHSNIIPCKGSNQGMLGWLNLYVSVSTEAIVRSLRTCTLVLAMGVLPSSVRPTPRGSPQKANYACLFFYVYRCFTAAEASMSVWYLLQSWIETARHSHRCTCIIIIINISPMSITGNG